MVSFLNIMKKNMIKKRKKLNSIIYISRIEKNQNKKIFVPKKKKKKQVRTPRIVSIKKNKIEPFEKQMNMNNYSLHIQ